MRPFIVRLVLASLFCSSLGCAMCCGPYDYDYPSVGGKQQRMDPTYGRVGSILSDPMASPSGGTADSNLKPPKTKERRGAQEDTDETQKLRDRIQEELDDKQQSDPQKKTVPNDSKEAFQRIQRPKIGGEWR